MAYSHSLTTDQLIILIILNIDVTHDGSDGLIEMKFSQFFGGRQLYWYILFLELQMKMKLF